MKSYNTKEIRAAARRLDGLANRFQQLLNSSIPKISGNAQSLIGDTSNALQNELDLLSSQITALRNSLSSCSGVLYKFAEQLDIADANAKAMIGEK